MCGIAGILSIADSSRAIKSMIQALQHRGPDAQAIYVSEDKGLALGHVRLSVIDLSSAANQPMHSADGRLTMVFNGEIYNYKEIRRELAKGSPHIQFRTHSDSETLLHAFAAWGPEMATKLNGMFALAIYDHHNKSLFLLRDRAGKKPLYYFESNDFFAFASEIKSLLQHPVIKNKVQVNHSSLKTFLHVGYIPHPNTAFTQIYKFPSGHWATKQVDTKLRTNTFWAYHAVVEKPNEYNDYNIDQIKSKLSQTIEDAVKLRLVSDVPVGSFLSGGTDSSLVTAMASKHHNEKLKTFSIGFKESKFDESHYASEVAKHLGTDHESFLLSENDALPLFDTFLNHFDEPFADTSAIPTMMVSKLTRKHVTVALTGDGGDELFLGYGAYDWAERLDNSILGLLKGPTKTVLNSLGNDRYKRIARLLEDVEPEHLSSHIFSQEQYFFSRSELAELWKKPGNIQDFPRQGNEHLTAAEQQALFDLEFYLQDDLLVKVDMASMYYALECRCPLLDKNVIELALNIPANTKKRHGERKWILKEILKEFLPNNLVYRPKWGFGIPLADWLNGKLTYLISDNLNEQVINQFGLVHYGKVSKLITRFRQGEKHLFNRIWVLIVLHRWLLKNG